MFRSLTLSSLLLASLPCSACELLVVAQDAVNPEPAKDQSGCYKRGMIAVIMDDDHIWGRLERLPKFVIVKIPGISKDKLLKYLDSQLDVNGDAIRRRAWAIDWASLPNAAKTKLADGSLTIDATGNVANADYTWTQIRTFFTNIETGETEKTDLK
jgi:hypothetical protein